MSESGIRNFIFDVDGTILDSRRDIAAAQIYTLNVLGVNHLQPEDIYPHIGKPLQETFRTLLPSNDHHRLNEAARIYREYYLQHALDTTILFTGVVETLSLLQEEGCLFAVATTKSSPTTIKIFEHFGIARFFSQIQGTDQMPFKPDPFILNKIITDQGWKREETAMVGDAEVDIGAGKNAGIFTCGVTYGSSTRAQLVAFGADRLIDSFRELRSLRSKEEE